VEVQSLASVLSALPLIAVPDVAEAPGGLRAGPVVQDEPGVPDEPAVLGAAALQVGFPRASVGLDWLELPPALWDEPPVLWASRPVEQVRDVPPGWCLPGRTGDSAEALRGAVFEVVSPYFPEIE
jgi:hypothetical protein